MNDYLLFDLDGTLTDPKEGITKCVQYALRHFGIEEPDLDKLEPFIGPPLKESFMEFYGFDEEKAVEAVAKYRERFQNEGIFENELYPGVPFMLKKLKNKGKKLAVSSSKPTVFVERILEHFKIRQYFDVVVGSELDGTRTEKKEVVEEALRQLLGDRTIRHDEVVMIGDRRFDVEGGRAHNITTVAVSYGYGSMEELKAAKAEYIVRTVGELEMLLLRGTEEVKKQPQKKSNIWYWLFPALIAYFVWQTGSYAGIFATISLADKVPSLSAYLVEYDSEGVVTAITGNGMAIINMVAFTIVGVVFAYFGNKDLKQAAALAALKGKRKSGLYGYAAAAAVAGMALGFNLLYNLLGLINAGSAYAESQQERNGAAGWLMLLSYCVFAPVAEELVFRGVLYNRVKKTAKVVNAMICSSLLFGLYHGNLITGSYAFLLGMVIALIYENTGKFYAAVAAHMLANLCAYLIIYVGMPDNNILNWILCAGCLIVGAAGVWMIWKKGNCEEESA